MNLFFNIGRKYRSIARYNQILKVLLKYGFEDLVQHLEERKRFDFLRKLIPKKRKAHAMQFTKWEKMRLVCEELGPTFVKFGQILSNRPDLIPFELVLEFEKLQDKVPPMSSEEAIKMVETQLGDKVDNLFAWFDRESFASASVAQVHKVILKDGKRAALKIQRPEIKEIIIEDIKVMYTVADVLERRIPSIRTFDPIGLVRNFENSILKELDFIHESINAQRFHLHITHDEAPDQFAYSPKVFPDYTSEKVLALEFVNGIKIDRLEELKEKEYDLKLLAERLSISFYKQVFEYGFFHADPHPGNLLVLPNRHICYLDFGMMGSILPRDVRLFGELFIAITRKEVRKIITVLQDLSNTPVIKDIRELEFDINEFVEKYYVRDVHDNEMSTVLLELKDIIVDHDIKVPTHFYLFVRAMVTIEGVISKLDPELDQFDMVRPYLSKSVSRKYNPVKMGKKVLNSIYEITEYMEAFPRDLKNAVRKINTGQIKVDLTHKGVDALIETMRRITKQVITAFIMVALIVGSTLFIISAIPPLWKGFSVFGIFGIILTLILATGMLRDINKNDYNNW